MLKRKTPLRRTGIKRSSFSPLRKSRLKPMSKKRQRESKEYSRLRKEFLGFNRPCELWVQLACRGESELIRQIWGYASSANVPIATQVHHKLRRRKNYLNVASWAALSAEGHRYVEEHASWSRANGWLA